MTKEETLLKHMERYKETIKNFTVMDDIFARNVFKDRKACEYVLRIILEDEALTVLENHVQMDFKNMHGRSTVLDCVTKNGNGQICNIEVQQETEGAHPKRARYHLGMLDGNVLDPGEFFDKLPETYVIFVTQNDTLGYALPIAHIDRTIKENGKDFGDEAHFIYVDSSKDDGGKLGELMRDFRSKEVDSMQDGALKDRVKELKETEKGVEHMCKEMEQLCDEREIEVKRETAKNLKDMGMSIEQIAQALKVNVQLIQDWLAGSVSAAR